MIVQSSHDTSLMQAFGTTLIIFNGIRISLENISAIVYLTGSRGNTLQQIIIITIHTSHHILPQTGSQLIHQDRLFSFTKGFLRRKHDLKIMILILKVSKDRTPKRNIVIALYIRNDTPFGLLGFQTVGRTNI